MRDFYIAKPYRLTVEHRQNYLYGYVQGEFDSIEASHGYWQEVIRECKKGHHSKVLLREEFREQVGIMEAQYIASSLSQTEMRDLKIAFVDPIPEHEGINEFGARVSTNRGMKLKIFSDEEAAEGWLLSD